MYRNASAGSRLSGMLHPSSSEDLTMVSSAISHTMFVGSDSLDVAVRARIEARRWQLELRREMLALAKQGCEDDVRTRSANRDVLASEKSVAAYPFERAN